VSKVDLASLIADTQEVEKMNLSDFESYMNQSTLMEKNLNEAYEQGGFIQQVINNNLAGKESSESIPDSSNGQKIWDILLSNSDYMSALDKLDLPQSMTADDRLASLVTYMQNQLQTTSDY
jgi:hypothetical protein